MTRRRSNLPSQIVQRLKGGRGGGRAARIGKCRTCKAEVLVGPDADTCAFRAQVDYRPLSPLGEVGAQLGGRRTYELGRYAGGLALTVRTPARITSRPAGQLDPVRPFDVLAEHVCRPPELPDAPSQLQPPPREETDHAPF